MKKTTLVAMVSAITLAFATWGGANIFSNSKDITSNSKDIESLRDKSIKLEKTIPSIKEELKEQRKISCAIALKINAATEEACLR